MTGDALLNRIVPYAWIEQGFFKSSDGLGTYTREATADEKLLWAEAEKLRSALERARAIIYEKQSRATHWEGCDKYHFGCAILKIICAALTDGARDSA